ncbi:hypothetical protein ILUMI_11415, partial [Ignelater luminosus]
MKEGKITGKNKLYIDTIEIRELNIIGTIPKWLNGELIRNGPGTFIIENSTFQHVFDSLALLRKFTIATGEVIYQCKFLESEVYKACNDAKRIVIDGFGTKSVPDPCHSLFQRVSSVFVKDKTIFDNSSVLIYPIHDKMYAFGEVPILHKINKENLKTEESLKLKRITENYFTIVEQPFTVSVPQLIENRLINQPPANSFKPSKNET